MYSVDPNIRDLQVKERVISRLSFSMNAPMIATPELSTEEARCYILLFREGSTFASYIGLYLPASDRRFYYAYSGNPLPETVITEALEEAARFAEEMGFVMDELKLTTLSVDERNKWIEDQLLFGYKKKEIPAESQPVERADAGSAGETAAAAPLKGTEAAVPGPPPVEAALPGKQASAAVPAESTVPAPQPVPVQAPKAAEAVEYKMPEAVEYKIPEAVEYRAPSVPQRSGGVDDQADGAGGEQPEEAEAPPSPPRAKKRGGTRPQAAPARTAAAPRTVPVEREEGEAREERPAAEAQPVAQQKPKGSSAIQRTTGTVMKEYEALARLLASF